MAIKSTKIKYLVIGLTFFCISILFNTLTTKPSLIVSKESSALNINDKILKIFSSGQSRLISGFLWISTLLESDTEHYKKKDLSSWMFLRFRTIVELDPQFLNAYRFGGKYLNIIKDDLVGSEEIFNRGLKLFPNDYELLFNYGFLLAFEMQDPKKALPVYEKLLTFPQAPKYLSSIILKLKFENLRDPSSTILLLRNLYETEPEGSYLRSRLLSDISKLQIEIDINCLNQNPTNNCNKRDPYGNYYPLEKNKYRPPKGYTPYRLHRRTDD